jgi:hypothetical protein
MGFDPRGFLVKAQVTNIPTRIVGQFHGLDCFAFEFRRVWEDLSSFAPKPLSR